MAYKRVGITVSIIILLYFSFTSGLVFEVSKAQEVGQIDTPYSIAFSNERVGLIGIYEDDDLRCARWIVENGRKDYPIRTDYFGYTLILGINGIGSSYLWQDERNHYLFLGSWNNKLGKMILGWDEGVRTYQPLPDCANMEEIYRVGNSVIYEVCY